MLLRAVYSDWRLMRATPLRTWILDVDENSSMYAEHGPEAKCVQSCMLLVSKHISVLPRKRL